MTRLYSLLAIVAVLGVMVTSPALAADPVVSKRVLSLDDGSAVIVLNVEARGRSVYGITITDASESVTDIIAPDGWVAISSGDRVLFRTIEKPIRSGSNVTLRIVTGNAEASLELAFRDAKTYFGSKKTI